MPTDRRDYLGAAQYDGNEYGARFQGGRTFRMARGSLAPYAGLRYLNITQDAHTETGSEGGVVQVEKVDVDVFETIVGLRAEQIFRIATGELRALGHAGWRYDWANDGIRAPVYDAFARLPGDEATPDDSVFELSFGLGWSPKREAELVVGYDGRFSSDYDEHAGYCRAVFSF